MIQSSDRQPLNNERITFVVASILVAACLFAPRPLNFTPLGAFGLFAGAYVRGRSSWIYPLLALTIYIVGIGGYHGLVLATVLVGFAGPAVIGRLALQGRVSALRVGGAAIASSCWFFLVSNFGSWLTFGVPRGESLVFHYTLGIPFFRNTLAGDLVFSAVLFGGYALAGLSARKRVVSGSQP